MHPKHKTHNHQPPGSNWHLSASGKTPADRLIVESKKHIFDELVVDDWLHLEQMDDRHWWMQLGDNDIEISILSNGEAKICVRNSVIWPMGNNENLLKAKT